MCPELHFIDCKMETHRRDRVTAFFPELDTDIFTKGRANFRDEMLRINTAVNDHNPPQQLALNLQADEFKAFFRQIVKPRESTFRFSDIGTILADDPKKKLQDLFLFFVERNFAQHADYQEALMTKALAKRFRAADVMRHYKPATCGDENYNVKLPFVHESNGVILRAIKPLDLAKSETTKITEHGDQWYMRITRLEKMNRLPAHLLFAVKEPADPQGMRACRQVCDQLKAGNCTTIIPYKNTDEIIDFAKAL
jgi:hypothetical protein